MLSRNFCEKSLRENFCNFHSVYSTFTKIAIKWIKIKMCINVWLKQHSVKIMETYYRIIIGTIIVKLTLSSKRTDLTRHLFGVWNKVWKKREISHWKKFRQINYSDLSNISGVLNKHMEVCKFFSLVHKNARFWGFLANFCLQINRRGDTSIR